MSQIFKRKKRQASPLHPFWNWAAMKIRERQGQAAAWLAHKTSTWNKEKWQTVLIVFCTGAIITLCWMIRVTLINTASVIPIQEIVKPRPIIPIEINDGNPTATLWHLRQMKDNLDSLNENNNPSFQQLMNREPHLLDSLNGLIESYNEQLK